MEADFVEVFKRYLPARLWEAAAAPESAVTEQEAPGNGPNAVPLNQDLETSKEAGQPSDEKTPASTKEPELDGPAGENAAAA